ncbi:MAG: histidine kinase dimerization/phospho-acceptor domain-containing protein, partial [Pseudonocardiaceae bacterium]
PGPGQLAHGIAHELNTLLTTIIGHVALLLEDSVLSPTAREDLGQIQQAADRAVGLARQLQGFAPASLAEHAPAGPAASAFRGDETILVEDDDEPVRELATTDSSIARHRMLEPGTGFLKKPFRLERLLRKVRQVLGAAPAGTRPA